MLFISVHLFHVGQANNLRSDVPAIPPPPDRAQWEKEHGKPYRVPPFRRQSRFNRQARACLARDYGTIERDKAIDQQVRLDAVCERVKTSAQVREQDEVFFDLKDGNFWVYPEK